MNIIMHKKVDEHTTHIAFLFGLADGFKFHLSKVISNHDGIVTNVVNGEEIVICKQAKEEITTMLKDKGFAYEEAP